MSENKKILFDAGLFIGAATALTNGVTLIYTYDIDDWKIFESEGLTIIGPPSVLA